MQEPKFKIPKLYKPGFSPTAVDLNEFVRDIPQEEAEVLSSLSKKAGAQASEEKPLTIEEARKTKEAIQIALGRIDRYQEQITRIKNKTEQQLEAKGLINAAYEFDMSKQPTLKKAIRKVFGIEVDTITYEMYKHAVDMKKLIEAEQVASYTKGEF